MGPVSRDGLSRWGWPKLPPVGRCLHGVPIAEPGRRCVHGCRPVSLDLAPVAGSVADRPCFACPAELPMAECPRCGGSGVEPELPAGAYLVGGVS